MNLLSRDDLKARVGLHDAQLRKVQKKLLKPGIHFFRLNDTGRLQYTEEALIILKNRNKKHGPIRNQQQTITQTN